MRITLRMLNGRVLDNLMSNAEALIDAQTRASSGKRIMKPSDDVTGTAKAMRLRSSISELEQFNRNAEVVKSQLAVTSSILDAVVKAVNDMKQIAVTAANPALPNEGRTGLTLQLDQIRDALLSSANTKYNGKYIFAGSQTQLQPIIANGAGTPPYDYQGDNRVYSVQVSPGTYVNGNVTGDVLFNMGGTADPGVPDLFQTIATLRQEILDGDTETISARIADTDAHFNNLNDIPTQVGARMNRLESTVNLLLDSKVSMRELLSQTEDADLTEALVDLRTRENTYQAAIETAQRLFSTSLVDYLK